MHEGLAAVASPPCTPDTPSSNPLTLDNLIAGLVLDPR
jgi:hypothetical protein